jgi:hypothetical protein
MKLEDLNESLLDRLQEVLASSPGRSAVAFDLRTPEGGVARLELNQRVKLSQELLAAARELCGEGAINLVM